MTFSILKLSALYLRHNGRRTFLLIASLGVIIALPIATTLRINRAYSGMQARAKETPLVLGAKGSEVGLLFNVLYFRPDPVEPVRVGAWRAIAAEGLADAIPLHTRFAVEGVPVVGTSFDYFKFRGLELVEGAWPGILGEAVVGSRAAKDLGLSIGSTVIPDKNKSYGIVASPLGVKVVGILEEHGTPDDEAIFVDYKTTWVVEGIGHAHEETSAYHFHGDDSDFPLTAVIVLPKTSKARTLLLGRYQHAEMVQLISPSAVLNGVMNLVFRIKAIVDAQFAIVLAATSCLFALILTLSYRLRREEFETLDKLGCPAHTVASLFACEIMLILAGSCLLGGALGLVLAKIV